MITANRIATTPAPLSHIHRTGAIFGYHIPYAFLVVAYISLLQVDYFLIALARAKRPRLMSPLKGCSTRHPRYPERKKSALTRRDSDKVWPREHFVLSNARGYERLGSRLRGADVDVRHRGALEGRCMADSDDRHARLPSRDRLAQCCRHRRSRG